MDITPQRQSVLLGQLPYDPGWLEQYLDKAVDNRNFEWGEPVGHVRGSSVSLACVRCMVLGAMGHREMFEPRVLRIFKVGDYIEDGIIAEMKDAGVFINENQQVLILDDDGKVLVDGHYDQRIRYPRTGEMMLVETKSIKMEKFDEVLPEPVMSGDFGAANVANLVAAGFENYITQWMTYAFSEGLQDKGYIIFECKNTQRRKYYPLRVIHEVLDPHLAKVAEACTHITAKTVPDRGGRLISKAPECRYCSHHALCSAIGKEPTTWDETYLIGGKHG